MHRPLLCALVGAYRAAPVSGRGLVRWKHCLAQPAVWFRNNQVSNTKRHICRAAVIIADLVRDGLLIALTPFDDASTWSSLSQSSTLGGSDDQTGINKVANVVSASLGCLNTSSPSHLPYRATPIHRCHDTTFSPVVVTTDDPGGRPAKVLSYRWHRSRLGVCAMQSKRQGEWMLRNQ